MFTDLFLNPKNLDKVQRIEKIKSLCVNNVLFKRNFNGFNYTILDKKYLFDKNNTEMFYNYINNIKLPIYEVLSYNTYTKIYMDCEMEDLPQNIYPEKDNIILEFNNKLVNYLEKKYPNNNIKLLYSDASRLKSENNYKLSLHVVVNNLGYFEDRKKLKILISDFSKQLPKKMFYRNNKNFVDHEVYHISQLIRIPFSSNKNPDSLLKPFIIENNNIIYKDKNYISNNYSDALCGFYDYNCKNKLDNSIELENTEIPTEFSSIPEVTEIPTEFSSNPEVTENIEIPKWKIKWIENNIHIKYIYKIDNINNNKINLKRIKSAYCNLCNRNHDSDNAFCIIYKNNIMLYCNRKTKGISIGSWYSNSTIKPNILEKENYLLKEKIINLEKKIINLEEKIKSLNILNKKENHICTNNKYKNENLFYNYYEAGMALINNDNNSFNELIKNKFKIKNLSLLKNRCLRIYELLEYAKINNFTQISSSLRKIFHIPNWKFKENLKKNVFFN